LRIVAQTFGNGTFREFALNKLMKFSNIKMLAIAKLGK
jgi:hypothetical protein